MSDTIPSDEATLWSKLQAEITRASDLWDKKDRHQLVDAVSALADLGELKEEIRHQVVKFLIRVAASKDKLDPKVLIFLSEMAVSSTARNRAFDALIDSSPESDD